MATVLLKAILMSFLPFYRVDFPISALPDQFTFTEHARGLEISRRNILKGDKEYSELAALLAAERAGWKYELTAYAPQRMFKSSGMNINCVGTRLVVNYKDTHHKWIQLSKDVQRPCQKVAAVNLSAPTERPLQGDVSVDDAYLGGEKTGGGPGRGSSNKVAFVAAVEMREGRPQRVRFDPVTGFSFAALTPWAKQALAPGCCVTSDGLLGFEVIERLKYEHKVVQAPRGKAGTEIAPFKWLNVVLGNLKTALSGTHHVFNFRKYARRYLAEVQYRFNRRLDMAAMVPRLAVAVTQTRPCPARRILGKPEVKT